VNIEATTVFFAQCPSLSISLAVYVEHGSHDVTQPGEYLAEDPFLGTFVNRQCLSAQIACGAATTRCVLAQINA